jgi:hypothetical protein
MTSILMSQCFFFISWKIVMFNISWWIYIWVVKY